MPVADLNDITDEEWARALEAMSEEDWELVRQELQLIRADLVRSRMEDARRLDSFWLPPRGPR